MKIKSHLFLKLTREVTHLQTSEKNTCSSSSHTCCLTLMLPLMVISSGQLTVHKETDSVMEKTFLCEICAKSFTDASNLRRHKATHNEKSYKCLICQSSFARSDYLAKHMKSIHSQEVIPSSSRGSDENKPRFQCPVCDKEYGMRKNLLKHMRNIHPTFNTEAYKEVTTERPQKRSASEADDNASCKRRKLQTTISNNNMACPACDQVFNSYVSLTGHLQASHDFDEEMETFKFSTESEFKVWKECQEKKTIASYVNRRGVRQIKAGQRSHLECHRSGFYKSKSTGSRIRSKETVKISAICPARMILTITPDGAYHVVWQKTHFGHECDVTSLRLTQTERMIIAEKLAAGASFDKILDDVRDSLEQYSDFTRFHLMDRRDLWNILRLVEFKHNHAHQNDAISVDILVESLKRRGERNPVVFYKPQDQPCSCTDPSCSLEESDFMIIVCTPYQQQILSKFTSDKVLIDSTHGTNGYDFQLTTLATVDSAGVGVPVAYCISSTVSETSMVKFFHEISDKVGGPLKCKVFMSDMAPEFYNAWQVVMGESQHVLYCSWHVDKRWRLKIKEKVSGIQNQVEVYRALITLRNILDKEWFDICVEGFKQMIAEDEETKPFLEYFSKYERVKEKWAYCYRVGLQLNTNMFMEAMFKKLKYSYMKGKKLRRVDECLIILMRFTRDIAYERLIRTCKGNNSYRASQIKAAHKRSSDIDITMIEQLEDKWKVLSSLRAHYYEVCRNEQSDCCSSCELMCPRCHTCVHEFKCSCPEHAIKGNMCKHIHAVVREYFLDVNHNSEEQLVENVQDSLEALCETATEECHLGKEVTKADMWKPISMHIKTLMEKYEADGIPESVVEGGLKWLEILRKSLPQSLPSSILADEEGNDEETIEEQSLASPRTPSSSLIHPQSRLTPTSTPGTPVNKKVSPQRRFGFRSLKNKPIRKSINFAKPTLNQEGSYIASMALQQKEVLNVHANDFDHQYCSMDDDL